VAALGNALTDSLNALFRAIQADINQAHKEISCSSLSDYLNRPGTRERGLNGEIQTGIEVPSRSKKDFASSCHGRLSRIAGMDPCRNCVCFEQVVATGKVHAPNDAAFA
jgi:hypothetical protein